MPINSLTIKEIMQIIYPKLVIAKEISVFFREITEETKADDIPAWRGVLVYHPATNQYYATQSTQPVEYAQILRTRKEPRYSSISSVLRKLLSQHRDFQVFVLPLNARPTVELWMAGQHKKRVITTRGSVMTEEHVLFEVYSPHSKLLRYICAPKSTEHKVLIRRVNAQLKCWLLSTDKQHFHERNTLQAALRSQYSVRKEIFDVDSIITPTNQFTHVKSKDFSARVRSLNIEEIRNFIHRTTTGSYF